jgi:hypothetical protein
MQFRASPKKPHKMFIYLDNFANPNSLEITLSPSQLVRLRLQFGENSAVSKRKLNDEKWKIYFSLS